VFFAALNALEGKGVEELRERLRNDWGETVVSNWMLWIPAQAVNLGLVPLHLQVLFGNVVSLAWNSYLSWVSHRHLRDSPAAIGDA
jgi:protein Mpv17